ncbi:MAG: type I restriction enzyme HsdR N-terminal domain-containing protein [Gemmatimonadetes bacterium]|nr:type I restriction enzyme HsdR N-terminal domain-containing protein [Gemmatimonadota bacterium]MDE2736319.1 type I restriction enzyme HsdR N-terminal domain-containing protein [Gemmatimonadota bacterium]
MALDDLKETIETLRERIQAHRAYLEGYETRTRQALIDPMLRVLGWDVENPDSVQLEHRNNQDRLDYVLIGSEGMIAVIEAKKLKAPLHNKATDQVIIYAHRADIPYMVVTDGDHWQMFDVFKRGQLDDRILMKFQLTRDEPYACALQALRIWRPNLASGRPQEAATPVMIEKPTRAESVPATSKSSRGKKIAKLPNNGDWVPLTSLKIEKGQKPPKYIKFPDSNEKELVYWTDTLVNAAQHLIETDKISAQNCPVRAKHRQTYLLHTEPFHSTGRPFGAKRKIGELWLRTSYKDSKVTHDLTCWLLDKFGIDPSTVRVSTNPS